MELLEILEKLIIPVATAVGGYLVGRPKQQAEVEATNVENAGKVIEKWEGYANRLEKDIEHLRTIIEDLNEGLHLANDERMSCAKTLADLQVKYDDLMKLYNRLQIELKRVKNEKYTTDNRNAATS
ncbi:hypothetical protein [Sphingobacterium sp. 40-24]|uniref:hypothetical protein n=1 Tax=Sphingobacterium sp. 40-24 TaxID=1895843 RepID=UPI000960B50C|nr:hypothetical protein [Sphingobacterium sp. 40-24]OJZ15059.1 MAG: hypothetical protein BGP15_23265 [Sphingobacterium sp. 40-24]